jgi:hypothetical protein
VDHGHIVDGDPELPLLLILVVVRSHKLGIELLGHVLHGFAEVRLHAEVLLFHEHGQPLNLWRSKEGAISINAGKRKRKDEVSNHLLCPRPQN